MITMLTGIFNRILSRPALLVTVLLLNSLAGAAGLAFADDFVPTITTLAGVRDRNSVEHRDGIPATQYAFRGAYSIKLDKEGNVYIVSPVEVATGSNHYKIKRVNISDGIIWNAAGNGYPGVATIGADANQSPLYYPFHITFGLDGNMILADRARFITVDSDSVIRQLAWVGYPMGQQYGSAMKLFDIGKDGNIYFTLMWDATKVFKLGLPGGTIKHIAGNGGYGYNGDDIDARQAALSFPWGIAVDSDRNCVYFSDYGNNRVRRIDLATNKITTYAGNGTLGSSPYKDPDGKPASQVSIYHPKGLAVDKDGNLYICAFGNYRIYKVDVAEPHLISTVAGGGFTFDALADDIPARKAFIAPSSVEVDRDGNLVLLCDGGGPQSWLSGARVRKVYLKPAQPSCPVPDEPVDRPDDGVHTVELGWTAPSDGATPAGYRVTRDGALVCDIAHDDALQGYTCEETGLADCTEYCYTITAYNDSGESGDCEAVCVETSDATPPSVPQNLAAAAVGCNEVALTWDPATDNCTAVSKYYVYENGGYIGSTSTTGFTATVGSHSDTNCFSVSAVDEAKNESDRTADVCLVTDTEPPACPQMVEVTAVSGTEVRLEWNKTSDNCDTGELGYRVYIAGQDDPVVDITDTSGNGSIRHLLGGLQNCSEYCFRVTAYDSAGNESAGCAEHCVWTPLEIRTGNDGGMAGKCGDSYNLQSDIHMEFRLEKPDGSPVTDNDIASPVPVLMRYDEVLNGWVVVKNPPIKNSADGLFSYDENNGVWELKIQNCSPNKPCEYDRLAAGEYMLVAVPNPSTAGLCKYGNVLFVPEPTCTFNLFEAGASASGASGSNNGKNSGK